MPRRTLTPATPTPSAPALSAPRDISVLAQSDPTWAANLQLLRRQWKWAAFSQFFYTFAPLLAMDDVALSEVEDDLARSTDLYLPRVMQRLLYTLTQDRKISVDNWQTALRKQYMKRAPAANPIGPEPQVFSRESSYEPTTSNVAKEESFPPESVPAESSERHGEASAPEGASNAPETDAAMQTGPTSQEPKQTTDIKEEDEHVPKQEADEPTEPVAAQESRDWTELPMLEKLDSLHLLAEWQFQNPYRLRQFMKSDDELAQWRAEPIGYDAKTNAYWLIGPDRLWIQRALPKPPRNLKRKRVADKAKASTSKAQPADEYEPESEPSAPKPSKRKRVQPEPTSRRPSRRTAQPAAPAVVDSPPGKSARAAKLQANKKLDAQAKELAEFQRQAAALSRGKERATRSKTEGRSALASPSRRPVVGTRASARLRGPVEEDDEWQPIPDEWLQESLEQATPRAKKGKAKEEEPEVAAEEEEEEEEEQEEARVTDKTGLDSDDSSELTELTEEQDEEAEAAEAAPEPEPEPEPEAEEVRTNGKASRGRKTRGTARAPARSKEPVKADTPEPAEEPLVDDAPQIPEGFVEWETICVTLYEWEHIAERFEKATHYLEKALYKMLSQNIVPGVTAELREIERKQRMEEALSQRKRSSRIALKESEKEEARLAAKKKAEEEEKNARARRLEARMKKEEDEREKREKAREQRRIEREEREARARDRAEKNTIVDVDGQDSSSVPTPTANGTHSTGSVQLSRVTTPSGGVRTPDWMLDCEVCRKSGLNLDDGLPMVSCGSCSRWQHITCHDQADRKLGLPKRNWEDGQFFCLRCRHKASSSAYNSHATSYSGGQHSWSQGAAADSMLHLQKAATQYHAPYQQGAPDPRYYGHSPPSNGVAHGHSPIPSPVSYSRPQQSQGALTFSHYQPEMRGFSTSRNTHPQHSTSSLPQGQHSPWGNGYGTEVTSRPGQAAQFATQYTASHGTYADGRVPAAYPGMPAQAMHPYGTTHASPVTMSNTRWVPTGASGSAYPPSSASAVHLAADALTYMHESAGSRHAGWVQPQVMPTQHAQPNGDAHPDRSYIPTHAGSFPSGSTAAYSYQHSPT